MPAAYEFGPFRLDPVARTLIRFDRNGPGQLVAIGSRALDLLLALVQHAGQVMSKRRLLEAVWPGGTVEDSNLTVQLTNLRRVIDAESAMPTSLIRTVHGRGYLLGATVREIDGLVTRTVVTRPDKPSITVLPFRNIGGKPKQDDFAYGLLEDIATALSCTRSLSVVGSNSAFAHRNQPADARQVGRELGVRYVLEGGIRQAGIRTRITGQLIDVASGDQIWAGQFDSVLEDGFDLQDRIATHLARTIEPKLQQAEINRARTMPSEGLTASDLFLQALGLFQESSERSLHEALRLLDQAIAADPSHAASYGLAAWCCRLLVNYGRSDDEVIRERGVKMAKLAVSCGKDNPLPLALGGAQIALLGGDHAEGLAHIERALTLNANSARAWELCGWVSFSVGAHDRSVDCFKRAMRLSPFDPLIALSYAGIAWPYFFMGRYDEAIAWADKACLEMPNSALPLRPKIACAALAGRTEDVRHASQRLRAFNEKLSITRLMQIDISKSQAQRDIVEAALRKAGIPQE